MDTTWYSSPELAAERRHQYEETARIHRILRGRIRKNRRR